LSKLFSLFSNKHAWLAFFAGLAMTFSYAPFSLWPIAIFSLIAACYVTDKHSLPEALLSTALLLVSAGLHLVLAGYMSLLPSTVDSPYLSLCY
tara:strand:+ start:328 stop:606 length:279 start_codon:yes stop_codon:yes gene_type:complete